MVSTYPEQVFSDAVSSEVETKFEATEIVNERTDAITSAFFNMKKHKQQHVDYMKMQAQWHFSSTHSLLNAIKSTCHENQ